MGLEVHRPTIQVILPIGISFYTFQTLSYTLDIYRRQLTPTRNIIDFALFVSFFPQLLAGPIERARNLLPQIQAPRQITAAIIVEGLYLFGWGLFKKVLLADTIAPIVNHIFAHPDQMGTGEVLLGLFTFSLQLYWDFSGYTDMARGLAKLMGFHLMLNFRFPAFAERLSDFWGRWHISLSTWIRDYVYIALGSNRRRPMRGLLNVVLVMTLIGLWHGAAWTFVIWGVYFGVLQAIQLAWSARRGRARGKSNESRFVRIRNLLTCRVMVIFSLIFFRSEDGRHVGDMFTALLRGFSVGEGFFDMLSMTFIMWAPFRLYDYWQFRRDDQLRILRQPVVVQFWLLCAAVAWGYTIFLFSDSLPVGEEFIYFQF